MTVSRFDSWVEEEINLLKMYYPTTPIKRMTEEYLPNRTATAIISKASNLKIRKKIRYFEGVKNKLWTKQEIEILKKYYFDTQKEELLKLLPNRTWSAIYNKIHFLNVKRGPDIIKKELKESREKIIARLNNKTFRMVKIEKTFNKPFNEIYTELRKQNKTHEEIKQIIGIDTRTLTRYINRLNINRVINVDYKLKNKFKLTETQKAYLAGFLDADGTISLVKRRNRYGNPSFFKTVEITNTNKNQMIWFSKITNLSLQTKQYTKKKSLFEKNKYTIGVYGYDSIIAFLEELLPYLVAKNQRAKLLILFCRSRLSRMGGRGRSRDVYTKEELEIADKIRTIVSCEGHPSYNRYEEVIL